MNQACLARCEDPDETVWSRFGAGYGYLPLALPVAALVWLRRHD
jgi:hypothetical protein